MDRKPMPLSSVSSAGNRQDAAIDKMGNWADGKVKAKIKTVLCKSKKGQTMEEQLCSWDPLTSIESRWKPGWVWLAALPPTQTPTRVLAPDQHTAQTC